MHLSMSPLSMRNPPHTSQPPSHPLLLAMILPMPLQNVTKNFRLQSAWVHFHCNQLVETPRATRHRLILRFLLHSAATRDLVLTWFWCCKKYIWKYLYAAANLQRFCGSVRTFRAANNKCFLRQPFKAKWVMTVGTLARHISTTNTSKKILTNYRQPRGKWNPLKGDQWSDGKRKDLWEVNGRPPL